MTEKIITFSKLPENVEELKAMPEASLESPFGTAALTIAVLCNYGTNVDNTIAMLDFLKGPEPVSTYEKQFLNDRLKGKEYKPFSFIKGATPANGYKVSAPYSITVCETPDSFREENWGTVFVVSGGADSPRQIKLRKKPSTGQWFLNEIQCLSDIRVPAEQDPWA